MATTRSREKSPISTTKMRPAIDVDARERQMIALAEDLAEQQLRDGTASSQVIAHYLKLGTRREKIEREILEEQKKLLEAKTEALKAAKRMDEMYEAALKAMSDYKSSSKDNEFEEDYEDEY